MSFLAVGGDARGGRPEVKRNLRTEDEPRKAHGGLRIEL